MSELFYDWLKIKREPSRVELEVGPTHSYCTATEVLHSFGVCGVAIHMISTAAKEPVASTAPTPLIPALPPQTH